MRPNFSFLLATPNALLKPGGLLRWKVRLVKDVRLSLPLTEVIKIVRLTSPLPDVLLLSLPRPKLIHGRRLALLSRPDLTLNLYILIFVLSLALLPNVPPLLTSPTFPLPNSRLRSSPITSDPTFLSPSQRPCIAEPEATFLSSAESRVLWSLTCLFAPPPPMNFLQMPLTSTLPLPLVQKRCLSHAEASSSLWYEFSFSYFQSFLYFR